MSYTSIIFVGAAGEAYTDDEIRNSWGWAPQVWKALHDEYIGGSFSLMSDAASEVWKLKDDRRLDLAEQVALHLTFDNALVKRAHFLTAAECLDELHRRWRERFSGQVWHAAHIAAALRRAIGESDVQAFWLNCTSVADLPLLGVYDEDREQCRPYNVNTDDDHFFIDVNSLATKEAE